MNFRNLAPGQYYVLVVGYAAPSPATSVDYTLFTWLLDSTAAGNMTVTAPTTATTGATGTVEPGVQRARGGYQVPRFRRVRRRDRSAEPDDRAG